MIGKTKHILADELPIWEERLAAAKQEVIVTGKEVGEEAGANCDWHDNFGYEDAKRRLEISSTRLREISEIVSDSLVISEIIEHDIVAIGKKVSLLIYNDDGTERRVTHEIGGYETPIIGRVSYASPLIAGLLGMVVGDIEELFISGKNIEIEILEIE